MGGIPPFEFMSAMSECNLACCFVRDLNQSFYQMGLRGLSDDVPAAVRLLADIGCAHEFERVVCTGVSAGAFAATLFGAFIGADEVHAFSPLTVLRSHGRAKVRNQIQFRAMKKAVPRGARYFDLKPVLLGLPKRRTEIHLHYGMSDRLDIAHVQRLRKVPGVLVHPYPGLTHANLAKALRSDGRLQLILRGRTD
jgi:hypothetical protein